MANRTAIAGSDRRAASRCGVGAMLMPFLILGAAGGAHDPLDGAVLCAAAAPRRPIATVKLDAEQMGNARTIVTVTAGRHLPVHAAVVVASTTAYTEVAACTTPARSRPTTTPKGCSSSGSRSTPKPSPTTR